MIMSYVRTIALYLVLIVCVRLMGKRQIGELEPIELVLTLLISDLASVPMQDFGIPLLNGVKFNTRNSKLTTERISLTKNTSITNHIFFISRIIRISSPVIK